MFLLKKSNLKIKKFLSDGTEAKVGMLVKVIAPYVYGNDFGTITKIVATNLVVHNYTSVACELIKAPDIYRAAAVFNYKHVHIKTLSLYERLDCLVKATPEERKEYYKRKFNSQ